MLKILARPHYSCIVKPQVVNTTTLNEFYKAIREIDEGTKLRSAGYIFSTAYKAGKWDGYNRFITKTGVFLTGLMSEVVKIIRTQMPDTELEIMYHPKKTKYVGEIDFSLKGLELRPYQTDAIESALFGVRGILKMPTGSGKTEVGCSIVQNLLNSGNAKKVLWLTHTLDLVLQTKERFEKRTDVNMSFCSKGQIDFSGGLTIGTVQTLSKSIEKMKMPELRNIDCVILDECHLGTANTWESVLKACDSAWWRFGLSGTPFTDDIIRNRKLIGLTGRVQYEIPTCDVIEENYAVPPTIYSIEFSHKEYMSYPDAISFGVDNNEERNRKCLTTILEREKGTKGLILVQHLVQGAKLFAMAKSMGFNCLYVNGGDTDIFREQAISSLKKGEIDFLIATNIFDFGIDIPIISWLFLASPSKSSVRILQRIGRVMRKSSEKKVANVYAFSDRGDRYLSSSWNKLKKVASAEGFVVK